MSQAPTIQFLGATGTVTGSKFLIDTGEARVLVDAGLFQGLKELRNRNWAPLPIGAKDIDAVVLSHAHLDHVGYLPVLTRSGFGGPIHATEATAKLAAIVLADSGRLQEEDADYANQKAFSKHSPAQPLYTEADAVAAAGRIVAVPFDTDQPLIPGITFCLRRAAHILGSASVCIKLDASERILVFSGDLGRPNHPLLLPPEPLDPTDVLVVESTYGNRQHDDAETSMSALADVINRTAARQGIVVVPAFAVDRTEVLLYHLAELVKGGQIPRLPIYVDSPMALSVLDVYRQALAARDPELRPELFGQDPFNSCGFLHELRTREQSQSVEHERPSILISASGMATGGRVVHHLANLAPDPRNSIVLVGYQSVGTRGQLLAQGVSPIRMLGQDVPIKAEVAVVHGLSAHADGDELIAWMSKTGKPPAATYLVHGETDAAVALRDRIKQELGRNAVVPVPDQVVSVV